jgi:hypothetical protein
MTKNEELPDFEGSGGFCFGALKTSWLLARRPLLAGLVIWLIAEVLLPFGL